MNVSLSNVMGILQERSRYHCGIKMNGAVGLDCHFVNCATKYSTIKEICKNVVLIEVEPHQILNVCRVYYSTVNILLETWCTKRSIARHFLECLQYMLYYDYEISKESPAAL